MITRQTDATLVNRVVNHPAVRPDLDEGPIATPGYIDMSHIVRHPAHRVLYGEHGGCTFIKIMHGVYEVHTACLPEGRGQWILDTARACADWMFTQTDCIEITSRGPVKHRGACRLAENVGLKKEFVRGHDYIWRGEVQDINVYSYRIQDWVMLTDSFDEKGREFHDFLHAEADRLNIHTGQHPDDPNHNRYVGISLAMAEAGQVYKAVNWFNRWAFLARHPLIKLVREHPVTVEIDLGLLILENGTRRIEPLEKAA